MQNLRMSSFSHWTKWFAIELVLHSSDCNELRNFQAWLRVFLFMLLCAYEAVKSPVRIYWAYSNSSVIISVSMASSCKNTSFTNVLVILYDIMIIIIFAHDRRALTFHAPRVPAINQSRFVICLLMFLRFVPPVYQTSLVFWNLYPAVTFSDFAPLQWLCPNHPYYPVPPPRPSYSLILPFCLCTQTCAQQSNLSLSFP